MNRIATDITMAITPPSLFGIDCRIAYANRIYNSGLMCADVTREFAGVKLFGSNLITVQHDPTVFSLLHFCRQLYMFQVLTAIIRSWYCCNCSFWY